MSSDLQEEISIGNFTFVRQLNIILGNKCTATCNFCTNESSPWGRLNLDIRICRDLIKAANLYGFRRIGFSGGEPFLYRKTLFGLTELCEQKSMQFVIATNGYWAKHLADTNAILRKLKEQGLVKLQLSYDAEHAKFVESEPINNILTVCDELSIPVILYSAYNSRLRLNDILDISGFSNVKVNEGPVLNVGRARTSKSAYRDAVEGEMEVENCPRLLQLTVNFDGEVYPCCSIGGFSKRLSLGNIQTHSFGELFENVLRHTLIFYLQTRDISSLTKEIVKVTSVPLNSVCELCNIIHNDASLFDRVTAAAENEMIGAIIERLRVEN